MKSALKTGFLLSISWIFCLITPGKAEDGALSTLEIEANGHFYTVELAISPEQRRRGLMYRTGLDRNRGMLLVYQQTGNHRIWMKNMQIALQIYWLDSDFRVIGQRRVEPCSKDPCPIYGVSNPSRYILELSDNEHDLSIGDRITGLNVLP